MSWAVDAIVNVRDSALSDAEKVDPKSKLHDELVSFAESADTIRKKIVATKEGGAITGEGDCANTLGISTLMCPKSKAATNEQTGDGAAT